MTEKQIKNQIKKIKKSWPSHLKPILLPDGQLRVVKRLEADNLKNLGIDNVEGLMNNKKFLDEGGHLTNRDNEAIQSFIEFWRKVAKETDPNISAPLLEKNFPGIFDEI